MRVYILRHLGVSRREAGLMPAWERESLIAHHQARLGIGQPQGQGDLSASEVQILTTPGIGG